MTAVVLACTSAALFGLMTVAVRLALHRRPEPTLGSLAITAVGLAILLAAAAIGRSHVSPGELWPYALAGLLAPGGSQLLFTAAVGEAGPSRTSVVAGTAPLVAVAIAVAFFGESLTAVLALGVLLVCAGGVAFASERVRPEHFRMLGVGFAFGSTVLFATRDNLVRWLATERSAPPLAGAAATLAAALCLIAAVVFVRGRPSRTRLTRTARVFAPAGLLFGLSYVTLFEAYAHGPVTVVSPLVATESLWGVAASLVLLRRSELVGRRLVLGAALVVAGGALIGATR